jgi:hypothetical protein
MNSNPRPAGPSATPPRSAHVVRSYLAIVGISTLFASLTPLLEQIGPDAASVATREFERLLKSEAGASGRALLPSDAWIGVGIA